MSHLLPEPLRTSLQNLISAVEERLQAETHTVGSAMAENAPAFEVGWVESHLTRAVIVRAACSVDGGNLVRDELPNGGVEITSVEDDVERRFRLRRATLDGGGGLIVTVSSDSILTLTRPEPTLFDDEEPADPRWLERWVIAYVLHPVTRTFAATYAARVMGIIGKQPPYRLRLTDVVQIPHTAPLPPEFKPDQDDLDLPEDDEGRGEQSE